MIFAIISAAFLAGFIFGWALIPLLVGAGILVIFARFAPWWLIGLAVLASTFGALRSADPRGQALDASWISDTALIGKISGPTSNDGRVQRFVFRTDDNRRLCARTFSRVHLARGDRIAVNVSADSVDSISPGYAAFLRASECDWSATLDHVTLRKSGTGIARTLDEIRGAIAKTLVRSAPGDAGALLAGIVVGDDSMLSADAMDAFERTGTLHVVAISGSNLTLLISILFLLSAWSRRRRVLEVVALTAIWGYVLVGGSGPPTLRAGMLATAASGAKALGRPADLLTLSVQVAAIQAFIWPTSVLGLSYKLSTIAIFGVIVAANGRTFASRFGALKLVVLTTLIVNLALLPVLPEQSRPSLVISIITNTVIAPLISFAFIVGLLAVVCGLGYPVLGESLAVVAAETNELTIGIVRSTAEWRTIGGPLGWDGATIPTAVLYVLAALAILAFSTEFRRAVGDLCARAAHVDKTTSMLTMGAGFGACAGVLVVGLLR